MAAQPKGKKTLTPAQAARLKRSVIAAVKQADTVKTHAKKLELHISRLRKAGMAASFRKF
jgi:post-segregation antitoxin (ccd killing protein)